MGTIGAMPLCWGILSFLLLQGYDSWHTTTQTSSPQGNFGSLNVITEPASSNTGDIRALETNSPVLLSSIGTSAPPKKTSQVSMVTSKPTTLRSSMMYGRSSSSVGLPQSQPQTHTTEHDRFRNSTPKSTTASLRIEEYSTIVPTPTSESVLTVAAFGVISFIVILVVVVIILVSVVSLRFKCRKNKESEDPQKPGSSGISESCSPANGEKGSITLISMKNINTNNSKGCSSAEKVL